MQLRQQSGICWSQQTAPMDLDFRRRRRLADFPGLVRYDEVAAGQIHHAIRFTLQQSRAAVVFARHACGGQLHQRECAAHGHASASESGI